MPEWIFVTILSVITLFVFLFTFWRGLKDDYLPSQIFSTSLITLIFFGVSLGLSKIFGEYRFWIAFFALILGYVYGARRNGLKIFDGYDSFILSLLTSGVVLSILLFYSFDVLKMIFFITVLVVLIVFNFVRRQYKSFIWYRSGKRGFTGLFTTGLFFLIRAAISFQRPDLTIMVTTYDIFISGLISFISFLNIFILGRK